MFPKTSRKPSTGTVSPPKSTFNSNPVDERITFGDALNNQRQLQPIKLLHNPPGKYPFQKGFKLLRKDPIRCKGILFSSLTFKRNRSHIRPTTKLQHSSANNESIFNPSKSLS
ncbi:hypothetical protein CDAR_457011 [Caerostris darwini]|uniref:Uncharacterized protein n=1 Tax=Caerostris darwini TaxID=1538125 RepID=A0AAV4PXD4_9ARAC|nr:hypothetical protein CDAR_457011 [Caerostris darwini]